MQKIRLTPEWRLILGLVLVKLVLHFVTNTNYGLHRDTFLYLALGDHLDFGYMSVPPLIALFAKITTTVFGDSVFAIRLFPALIGAASVVIIAMIVRLLGGRMWAILLACTAFIVSPAFLRSNTLFQPVSFDQFFWLLAIYFAIKLVRSKNPKYWLHIGVVCGLAFLNKYSIAFLVFAFLAGLLLTPARSLFRSKYFLYGSLIGFLIILPNLIWQHEHNWPVVTHMLTLQQTQLVNVNIADFIVAQILMNLPGLFVWLFGVIFLLFFKEGQKYRFLGYTFLALLLVLILLRGKPYYTLGIYTPLFAFGGYASEKYFSEKWRFVKPGILAFMLAIVLPVLPYSLPLLAHEKMLVYAEQSKQFGLEGALRWEDGRLHDLPQDYADMIGWQELASVAIETYNQLSEAEQARTAIYAENYGQAGAVKFYGKKHGLPEPVSFNASFLFWAPDSIDIETLIYINYRPGEDIYYYFAEVEPVGRMTNPYARESGLPVFLCRYPRNDFAGFYREKVKMLKDNYRRQ